MTALSRIIGQLPGFDPGQIDVDIAGLTDDSRQVRRGDLFVAVAGSASDGHAFAAGAVANGAVAVLAEHPLPELPVPVFVIADLKILRSEIAGRLYDQPSQALTCVGVTGTNGKTSIASFIAGLATALDRPAGYMGTIGWGTIGDLEPSILTTESAITIQQRLARFRDQGLRWAVLEASSHALDQARLDAVAFDYAVFSNLSRDHLDYHQDLESYGAAKARLFRLPGLKAAVINVDDAFGQSLISQLGSELEVLTYGASADAQLSWQDLEFHAGGVRGSYRSPWGSAAFELPLYGTFSVANVAAALAVLCHSGLPFHDVVAAARQLTPVPGRMEFFPGKPTLVVDYAHTPDALEKMLAGLRPHLSDARAHGKLICVCGCGGDRDRGKRPLMARAACAAADQVWLTSDNPRTEDPAAIIDDMLRGVPVGAPVQVQVDRRTAITEAVVAAGPDDLVVIAGKGHEDYQEVAGCRLPFSDREIAASLAQGQTAPAVGSKDGRD